MSKNKSLYWLMITLLSVKLVFSQNPARLSVGAYMPDVTFSHFYQNSLKEKSFNALKGRLVILDFWEITCSSCIKAMPKMEELQKKFADRLQVVLVTSNTDAQVEGVFKKLRRQLPNLPMLTNEEYLKQLFPYETVPHHVWIDEQGRVKYITNSWNATETNIEEVLAGRFPWFEEKFENANYDTKRPIFEQISDSARKDAYAYSCLIKPIRGLNRKTAGWHYDSQGKKNYMTILNHTLLELYQIAYSETLFAGKKFGLRSSVSLKTNHSTRFLPPHKSDTLDKWLLENTYSYEAKEEYPRDKDFFLRMQQDLRHYFPYKASVRQEEVDGLALVFVGENNKLKTKSGPSAKIIEPNLFILKNKPIDELLQMLIYSNLNLPYVLVDGTNYKENIDIKFDADVSDFDEVQRILFTYGLGFKKCKVSKQVLSIEDIKQ